MVELAGKTTSMLVFVNNVTRGKTIMWLSATRFWVGVAILVPAVLHPCVGNGQTTHDTAISRLSSLGADIMQFEPGTAAPITVCIRRRWEGSDDDLRYLRDIENLRHVAYTSERLTDGALAHATALPKLLQLDLDGKWFTDESLMQLEKCDTVEILTLNLGRCTDAGIGHLGGLIQLKELSICDMDIDGSCFSKLGRLKKLEDLSLGGTKAADENMRLLARYSKLRVLSLRRTNVTDRGLIPLRELHALEKLDLESTKITDEGLKFLATALPWLRALDLSKTRVTEDGMVYLEKFLNLADLKIIDTSVTTSAAAKHIRSRCVVWDEWNSGKIINDPPVKVEFSKGRTDGAVEVDTVK